MAKYEIKCVDGKFDAEFEGSGFDMLALACCVVAGIYNHMSKSDDSGMIAREFREICGDGYVFGLADKGTVEEYQVSELAGEKEDGI